MRGLALAAALSLAGCIDFKEITPPDPPPRVPAEFRAHLRVDDLPREVEGAVIRTGAHFNATLVPGRDSRGAPRPSRDDTLRISGVAVAPTRVEADGARVYSGWLRLPDPAEGGILLSLSPPPVAPDGRPPALHLPIPVRIGGDTLEVAADADLRLPFAMPPLPPDARALERRWALQVSGDRTQLTIAGEGLPPNPLVVSAGMLPATTSGWLSARLSISSHSGSGGEGGNYFIDVHFDASLGWTIRRGGRPPEG